MTEKEYNNCVSKFADAIYRFLLKNIRDEDFAKDLVQSSFEKLWIHHKDIKFETAKSYLFSIAYHTMIDHLRKKKNIISMQGLNPETQIINYQPNARQDIEAALYRLNDMQRSLILLKDYEGYSYAEIGEITELSESQVKVYLHRARVQLRDYLVKIENII